MSKFDQSKYINDFIKETYDTIKVQVPKGKKEVIKNRAKIKGFNSVNEYMKDLIRQDMNEPIEEKSANKSIKVENNKGVVIGENNNGTINLKK